MCVYVFGFVVLSSGRGELWGKEGVLLARIYCEVYFVGKEELWGNNGVLLAKIYYVLYFVGEEGSCGGRREFYRPRFIVRCCTL